MQDHIRAVGKIFIAFGVLGAVASLAVLAIFGGPAGLLAFDSEAKHNDITTIPVERLLAAVYIAFSLFMTVPLILVGRAILHWQTWAHTAAILTASAAILLFPLGSAVGVYGVWVMFQPETEPLFLNPPETRKNAPVR